MTEKKPAPPKMETSLQDTRCTTGVPPEIRWGDIYRMIRDQEIPDMLLEEGPIYLNIKASGITRAATRPELFPCAEVIGWILQHADAEGRVINDSGKVAIASFQPPYLAVAYKFPRVQQALTDEWLGQMNNIEMAKKLLIAGKHLRKKGSDEYDV